MADLPPQNEEFYVGDGLYASFDGWQIKLRAPRMDGDHFIALEPDTYANLRAWIRAHWRLAKHMGETDDS